MAAAPDFPAELHDLIVDHLHEQRQALGVCGLVCKVWLRSSRHHLFESVTLHDHNWEGFLRLSDSSLATFTQSIQSLSISRGLDDQDRGTAFSEMIIRLPILPALKHLRLSYVDWTGVSDTTVDAVLRVFGHITRLDIHLISFGTPHQMAGFVSRFSHLEEISLYPGFLHGNAAAQPHLRAPSVPRNLRTVRFRAAPHSGDASSFISWLQADGHPPAIRSLELGMLAATALPSLGDLIRTLGTELRDLNLAPMYHVTAADVAAHIDLTWNTRLAHLTLHLSLRRFQASAGAAHAPWALLAALRAPVTTLTIVLRLDTIDVLDNLDWGFLNATLQTLPALAGLQRLHFMVHCSSGAMDDIEGALWSRLAGDTTRKIVDISVLHTARVFTQV
ncbi:hypothetical protein FB451DRAFT_588765 [Mycena latifolia]|nr:hypothetical protein FB451DRAFT_588765 [Mycena latifolia]